MARRNQTLTTLLIIFASSFIGITFIWQFRNQPEGTRHPQAEWKHQAQSSPKVSGDDYAVPALLDQEILSGEASAPKLENATLKAELGRSAWHLLHTTLAKFPTSPTPSDSSALSTYIHLFARLYPCGDCARHFQSLLKKYPPQTGSRMGAATWGCFVHNEVNKRLGKEEFDCKRIGDFYDCGCGGEEEDGEKGGLRRKGEKYTALELEREEGLTRGG